jgi:hypothetical protein
VMLVKLHECDSQHGPHLGHDRDVARF